jgi:outer membrane murein-binding lipoprotein Lpp
MVSKKPLVALALASILLLGVAGPVVAHGWQTTVTQGPMELGVSSSPETPVAGMQTEFSARIADEKPGGDADRLDWGGVTNRTVEIHIRGPDGYHDHLTTEIPEDEAHFHWTYMFPTEGTYNIAVVTQIEGQEYAFQFQKNVTLLPAKATGEEMEHLSEEVHTVNENVNAANEEVKHVHEKVDALQTQVEELGGQVDSLQQQVEQEQSDGTTNAQLPMMGISVALAAVAGVGAFVVGRRF